VNKIFIVVLFMLCVTSLSSFGQQATGINKGMEDISGQCAECAAYFKLVYHAMVSSNETDTAKSYSELEDMVMFYSLLLANQGRDKDTAIEVTNSRIEMNMKMMKQETNNRNENISILINKYHFGCLEIIKNPPEILLKLIKNY
jgi:hypothetical protein